MAVATALHSAVTGGIKAVMGCDWGFVLLYPAQHQHSPVPEFLQRRKNYFRFGTGFLFSGRGVIFVVCVGLFRIFAGFVPDSDENKSLIISSLIPFFLMTSGYSATFDVISFGCFLPTSHYISQLCLNSW